MRKKALIIIFTLLAVLNVNSSAQENELTATITEFDVSINYAVIDNVTSDYPVLTHKDVTYIPMTYNYAKALKLKIDFDGKLKIGKGDQNRALDVTLNSASSNDLRSTVNVTKATFDVLINGQIINNDEEEYPLLVYKDITYFPMTWRFSVEEFDWKVNWTPEAGLTINTKEYDKYIQKTNRSKIESEEGEFTFRGFPWRTKLDLVTEIELGTPDVVEGDQLMLFYENRNFLGHDAYARFEFKNEKLVDAGYYFPMNYRDKGRYTVEYNQMKEHLISMYGEADYDGHTWSLDEKNYIITDTENQFISGEIGYLATWKKDNTDIIFSMSRDEDSSNMGVSISFRDITATTY